MRPRLFSCCVAVAVLSSCVETVLVPTGSVVREGARQVAFAEAGGVKVWAEFQWSGDPANLPDYVTPVLVTIENTSGRTVRLAYQDFTILGSTGLRYAALPPFGIAPGVSERPQTRDDIVLADYHPAAPVIRPPPPPIHPVTPRIHHHRFHVAPHYAHFYVGLPLWAGLWALNSSYYARWSPSWPVKLPTEDMLQRALPEGALDDGGRVTGHLYFQNVRREAAVQLQATLHEATTAADIATITIPFAVR